MLPAIPTHFTTVPQLSADLQRDGLVAPEWLVRRLADRLSGGTVPRVGWCVRLIDADLAERIRAALQQHQPSDSVREEAAHA